MNQVYRNGELEYDDKIVKIPYVMTNGYETRMMVENHRIYDKYREFGFNHKGDFILAHKFEYLDDCSYEKVRKSIAKERQGLGYKLKLYRNEIKEKAAELKMAYPELTYKERAYLAVDMVEESYDGKINWMYLNKVSDKKLKSIRYQKLNRAAIKFIQPLNKHYETISEFHNDFRLCFDWSQFGYAEGEWSNCAVLKGNYAVLGEQGRILSYNIYSKEGVIFDVFDMLNLMFNMSKDEVLELLNVTISQYDMYRKEQRYFNSILKVTDVIDSIPNVARLKLMDIYKVLITKGAEKMHTNNFKDDKAVFFYSIRKVVKELGLPETRSNISLIGSKINLLVTLGLLEKVFYPELPESLRFENKNTKDFDYFSNYFILPEIDFNLVKERAAKLKEHKVYASNVSFNVIKEIFSHAFARKVFNQLKSVILKSMDSIQKVGHSLYAKYQELSTCLDGSTDYDLLDNYIEVQPTLNQLDEELSHPDDDDIDDFF